MDPEITIIALGNAWRKRDYSAAYEYADALLGWIERGGYVPDGFDRDKLLRLAGAVRARCARLLSEDSGASSVEYALLLSLVCCALLWATYMAGVNLESVFRRVSELF